MKEKFIVEEIQKMIKTGSDAILLEKIRDGLKNSEFYKDRSFDEIIKSFSSEMYEQSVSFLTSKKDNIIRYISGLSSVIYLPDFNNKNTVNVKFIGGTTKFNNTIKVNTDTLFDVASATKLFTLVLLFKLEELGFLNLNDKVSDLNSDFRGLDDFTFNDLIKLHGEIYTDGNLSKAESKEEALRILNTMHLISKDRTRNKYTDFGAIAISKTIEKVMSEKLGVAITFDQIMNKFIFEPYGLNKSCFNPISANISGNGNNGLKVHDPKSRILGGAVGSAGLFITSEDLIKFANNLFVVNYVNYDKFKHLIAPSNLEKLSEITYPNSEQPQKGNLGIYVKHPLGVKKTYVPNEYSNKSFSYEGWTGSTVIFDSKNLIHNSILVNAINDDLPREFIKNDKVEGYISVLNSYIASLAQVSMSMLFVKKYFDKYYNNYENIDIKKGY